MPKNAKAGGVTMHVPNPGAIFQAQLEAAENATRFAEAACSYAVSMNRAWLELWANRFTQYTQLPRRLADVQRDMVEEALGDFQESVQQFGDFAAQAKEDVEDTVGQTVEQTEELARQARPRPQEGNRVRRDRRRERQRSGERRSAESRH